MQILLAAVIDEPRPAFVFGSNKAWERYSGRPFFGGYRFLSLRTEPSRFVKAHSENAYAE